MKFCQTKSDGKHPNPKDCSKYYTCSNGITTPERCASGLHYIPIYEACQAPVDGYCIGGKPSIPTPGPPVFGK
ncbi:hypothetical protein AC249_AIPGENE12295 [Exaiptasia diaphana]|nr:hypothetical protein AC249_AIPGENE12295 [Exaiptasia diaphana]